MGESLFHGNLVTTQRIVYTPSLFAKSNLLYLQETGSLVATSPHVSSRSGLSSFLFFIVKSGSGELVYEGKTYPLASGDCVIIDCTKDYSHKTFHDLWELNWVHFNGPMMSGIYNKFLERGGTCVFRPDDIMVFSGCLSELYEAASAENYTRDMQINVILSKLLSLIMAESWHPENKNPGKMETVVEVKQYLDEHYPKKISLNLLSEKFYVNKYYLTRLFRSRYDTTITGYLSKIRINEAKRLLRFSDLTIEEIGAKIGIADPNYLSRLFSKIEGISPSEYRKTWRSKNEIQIDN
jgi:AraC family transcriptional regulator of arabinose operon